MATSENITRLAIVLALSFVLVMSIRSLSLQGLSVAETCDKSSVKNVALGANLSSQFDDEISRDDLCLFEGEINLQGEESNTRELLVLGHRGKFIGPATALTSNQEYEDVVLEVEESAIKLYYVFDQSIDLTTASANSPLEIKFLGKLYKISKISSDAKFSAIVGDLHTLNIGEELNVGNKTVALWRVGGNGAIIIDVDGEKATIQRGGTKKIGGIEVTNIESFYDSSNLFSNLAELVVGEKSLMSFSDGDKYLNDSNWSWNIGGLTSKTSTSTSSTTEPSGPYIGIENAFEYASEDDNPPKAGNCTSLPGDYIKICFEGLTQETYRNLDIDVETADLSAGGGGSSETTTHFKTSGNRLKVGGAGTNEAWLTSGNNLYYRTSSGITSAGFDGTNIGRIEDLSITKSGSIFTISSHLSGDDLTFSFSGSEVSTLAWSGRNIKDDDGKLITRWGTIVRASSSRVKLQVPRDQVKARMNITSMAD